MLWSTYYPGMPTRFSTFLPSLAGEARPSNMFCSKHTIAVAQPPMHPRPFDRPDDLLLSSLVLTNKPPPLPSTIPLFATPIRKKKAKVLAPLDAEKLSTKSNNRSSCLVYLSGVCLWWIVERRGGSKEHHTTAATHASSYVVALGGDKRPVPVSAFTPQNPNPSSLVSGPPCLAGWPCRKRP